MKYPSPHFARSAFQCSLLFASGPPHPTVPHPYPSSPQFYLPPPSHPPPSPLSAIVSLGPSPSSDEPPSTASAPPFLDGRLTVAAANGDANIYVPEQCMERYKGVSPT